MSALPPKADIERHDGHAALCQKRTFALEQIASLFDHLVGAGEHHRCHANRGSRGSDDARPRRRDGRIAKLFAPMRMSAFGTKRHARRVARCPLSGVKRTWPSDGVRSAYDPKRTKAGLKSRRAAGSCVLSLVAAQEGVGPPPRFRTIQV